MKFKIGFACDSDDLRREESAAPAENCPPVPRKSVVQVQFPGRSTPLAYYNDRFDLRVGDYVYVDGKLEGKRGRVTDVSYNFRIRLSDYKRVIALADTAVKGQFCYAGSHFVTFDRGALPPEKAITWFRAPCSAEEEIVSSSDGSSFLLEELSDTEFSPAVAARGYDYYEDGHVVYLCLDGSCGYAIVVGSSNYEVEFEYRDGRISRLTCPCYCTCHCKHEYAAMLQLKKLLQHIDRHYRADYARSDYFAAILKTSFRSFVFDSLESGSFTLR